MSEVIIDVLATDEMTGDVTNLAKRHAVEIFQFATRAPAAPISNFPNLDPSVIAF